MRQKCYTAFLMAPPQKPAPKGPKRQLPHFPKMPHGDSFWVNLATSVLVLLLLAGAYSYFVGDSGKPADIALSQVAADINAGLVKTIEVNGNELKLIYLPAQEGGSESEKKSKKEPEAALSETFKNYGVSAERLAEVSIDIKREGGFQFWLLTLAPFLAPLLLLSFFFFFFFLHFYCFFLSGFPRGGLGGGGCGRPPLANRSRDSSTPTTPPHASPSKTLRGPRR